MHPGLAFRQALDAQTVLPLVGVINAYVARMAAAKGFSALYLSGAGVANASLGLPDLNLSSLNDVCEDVRRITSITDLPLLVDADTGWGSPLNVSRSIAQLEKAGAAGVHLEDQQSAKRCGHRQNKKLCTTDEMVARLGAARDGRRDENFFIMARTDALANESLDAVTARIAAYVAAGADGLFIEAVKDLETYRHFTTEFKVPVLANLTEFGQTPQWSVKDLERVGVKIALFPLSVTRAMHQAAEQVLDIILKEGATANALNQMQDRKTLYHYLDYAQAEAALDEYYQAMEK